MIQVRTFLSERLSVYPIEKIYFSEAGPGALKGTFLTGLKKACFKATEREGINPDFSLVVIGV